MIFEFNIPLSVMHLTILFKVELRKKKKKKNGKNFSDLLPNNTIHIALIPPSFDLYICRYQRIFYHPGRSPRVFVRLTTIRRRLIRSIDTECIAPTETRSCVKYALIATYIRTRIQRVKNFVAIIRYRDIFRTVVDPTFTNCAVKIFMRNKTETCIWYFFYIRYFQTRRTLSSTRKKNP